MPRDLALIALLACLTAGPACHAPMTADRHQDPAPDAPTGDTLDATDDKAAIHAILDDLHAAAAAGDGPRYFDHYAPAAYGTAFLGTDAEERWTLEQFRAYAEPYFDGVEAWTYTPLERNVELAPAGSGRPDVAWFDELLTHAKYGTVRGSGVLVRMPDRWRLTQYVLSFTVPNDRAAAVVEAIRAGDD